MHDLDGPPTPAAPVNPHAEIESIASGAIALPVRAEEHGDGLRLFAPHHTTPDGKRAILAALAASHPGLSVRVLLDAPPAEP